MLRVDQLPVSKPNARETFAPKFQLKQMLHIADHDLGVVFEGEQTLNFMRKDPLKETFQSLMKANSEASDYKQEKPKIVESRRNRNASPVSSETFAFGPIQSSYPTHSPGILHYALPKSSQISWDADEISTPQKSKMLSPLQAKLMIDQDK